MSKRKILVGINGTSNSSFTTMRSKLIDVLPIAEEADGIVFALGGQISHIMLRGQGYEYHMSTNVLTKSSITNIIFDYFSRHCLDEGIPLNEHLDNIMYYYGYVDEDYYSENAKRYIDSPIHDVRLSGNGVGVEDE